MASMTTDSELEQLRQATREARETLKDLRAAHKEAKAYANELGTELGKSLDKAVTALTEPMLSRYQRLVEKALRQSANSVVEAFVHLGLQMLRDVTPPTNIVPVDHPYRKLLEVTAQRLASVEKEGLQIFSEPLPK